jgi:hypothetical protein
VAAVLLAVCNRTQHYAHLVCAALLLCCCATLLLPRLVQEPGSIVVVLPNAYHSWFSTGFSIHESVALAPWDCLGAGADAERSCRQQHAPTALSHTELLVTLVSHLTSQLPPCLWCSQLLQHASARYDAVLEVYRLCSGLLATAQGINVWLVRTLMLCMRPFAAAGVLLQVCGRCLRCWRW